MDRATVLVRDSPACVIIGGNEWFSKRCTVLFAAKLWSLPSSQEGLQESIQIHQRILDVLTRRDYKSPEVCMCVSVCVCHDTSDVEVVSFLPLSLPIWLLLLPLPLS